MSFQLSMKFRWAARIFFCWASKSNFSPQKISTDSERVRCVISLFRSKKKNKSSLHQRIFRVNPFRYTKKFFGKKILAEGETFFFFLGGSAIENLLRPPFVWYCCTSSCLHFHLRLTYVAQEGRWRALTRGIMDSPRCVLGAHTQKNLDENGEDFQRDISLFSFFFTSL